MRNALFFILAFVGVGCMIAYVIDKPTWAAAGFFVAGGLMLVLYPRRAAGDPAHDNHYTWFMPDSQPARTIVSFAIGLVALAIAAAVVLT